jgi:hypothetical protein
MKAHIENGRSAKYIVPVNPDTEFLEFHVTAILAPGKKGVI